MKHRGKSDRLCRSGTANCQWQAGVARVWLPSGLAQVQVLPLEPLPAPELLAALL